MQKTISKSTKPRSAGKKMQPRQNWDKDGGTSRKEKNGYAIQWKQVVEIEEIGKNKKGKKIHVSKTKHIPA